MQDRIFDALRRGAPAEALTLARQAVTESPHDPQAYALLAQAARAAGDGAAAQSAINRAVLLAPEDAAMHVLRAGYLIGERRLNEAQAALARSVDLDPNRFEAYIVQAQLALGRGDVDEAERLRKLASRVEPEHPWVAMLEGLIASRRGDAARAQSLLLGAADKMPDDPQVLYALGFVYLDQKHYAFAEQAFRKVLALAPAMHNLRAVIADLLIRQQRLPEARAMLQPLLDDPETTAPAFERMAGELEMALGRIEAAAPLLLASLQGNPRDPRTLRAVAELWRRNGDAEGARGALDAALETAPDEILLWRLRLGFEADAGAGAEAVIDRWLTHAPGLPAALEAQMQLFDAHGRDDEAYALAQRIVELEPGRTSAEMRVIDRLLRDEPEMAIHRINTLLAKAENPATRIDLQQWLGFAQDRAGQYPHAMTTWARMNQALAPQRKPLPLSSDARAPWPPAATVLTGTPPAAYLSGLPGSGVERVAALIAHAGYPLRADRISETPPQDLLQSPDTVLALAAGTLPPERALGDWRAALPARGIRDGVVIDWLPFWDNALLKMTRPLQPEALVLIAIRDPRDMLLEWLAFGGPQRYAIADADSAARWMARQLEHVIELHQGRLQPHALIRTDRALEDIDDFAARVGAALNVAQMAVPPAGAIGPRRFDSGHWRRYAGPLAAPFAALTDVAVALGYPAA